MPGKVEVLVVVIVGTETGVGIGWSLSGMMDWDLIVRERGSRLFGKKMLNGPCSFPSPLDPTFGTISNDFGFNVESLEMKGLDLRGEAGV